MNQLIDIVLPEGCEEAGKFDHLDKTLYGLKQSSPEWFKIPAAFLLCLSFIQTYTNQPSSHKAHFFILIYVDGDPEFTPTACFQDARQTHHQTHPQCWPSSRST